MQILLMHVIFSNMIYGTIDSYRFLPDAKHIFKNQETGRHTNFITVGYGESFLICQKDIIIFMAN